MHNSVTQQSRISRFYSP